ncbi:hypothetical protein N9L02_01660 [Gammaproteobacteria bacterium]|nr:hypothetical protein [Gammaproteobacteria bacterium]
MYQLLIQNLNLINVIMLRYVNISKVRGVILISILFLVQIILMLSLFLLKSSFYSSLISSIITDNYFLFRLADNKLKSMENNVNLYKKSCIINTINRNDLVAKPQVWWQSNACIFNEEELTYYYFFEYVSDNKCFLISNDLAVKPIRFIRATLLLLNKNNKHKILLQSVIARIVNREIMCKKSELHVVLGRQSIKRLN